MGTLASGWQFWLLVVLFFLCGATNNLNDVLIKQFQKAFELTDMQAGLVPSAFYTGYFVGALPAAKVSHAHGYKASVMVGLGLFSLGALLFWPVSRRGGWYPGFLGCLYLIAFGLAFIQCAANPWVVALAEAQQRGSGTQALNFAQCFNPLGSIAGVLLGGFLILGGSDISTADAAQLPPRERKAYLKQEASLVGPPYLVLGAIVAAVAGAFWITPFPSDAKGCGSTEICTRPRLGLAQLCTSGARLWHSQGFAQALTALFFYVGAQVCVWSYIIRYVQTNIPGTTEERASDFIGLGLVLFVLGRFAASALLCVIREDKLLAIFAVLAGATCAIAAGASGWAGVAAVSATSSFMGMMSPTIFGLALEPLAAEDTEVASSLLVMCLVGGAAITPAMGAVSDIASIGVAYLVPCGCFLVVALFAVRHAVSGIGERTPLL